jgi:hypothetical protein
MIIYQCQVCHKQAMQGDEEAGWLEVVELCDDRNDVFHLCVACQGNKEAVILLFWKDPKPFQDVEKVQS